MKRTFKAGVTALTLLAGLGLSAGGAIADTYKVTIYNLTQGQILSPPVVAAHRRGVSIFTLGAPASPGLHEEAEDAKDSTYSISLSVKNQFRFRSSIDNRTHTHDSFSSITVFPEEMSC